MAADHAQILESARVLMTRDSASEAIMDDGAQPLQRDAPPQDAMLRMVLPAKGGGLRAAYDVAQRILGDIAAWAVVALVLILLFAPAAAFLVSGGWAVVTYIAAAITLYHLVVSSSLAGLLDALRTLDLAGRVAVTSASYYALLAALVVLVAGLAGRRWRRLFLFPGIMLTLPSALIFYFGLRMTLDAVSSVRPLSLAAQTGITLYLLLDAVLLAAFLVDLRPTSRHARRRNRHRYERVELSEYDEERRLSASLPLVRFGHITAPLAAGPDLDSSFDPDEAETAIVPIVPSATGDRPVLEAAASAQDVATQRIDDAPEAAPPAAAAVGEPPPPARTPRKRRPRAPFVVVAIEEPAPLEPAPEQPLAVEHPSPPIDEPALDASLPAVEDIAQAVSEPAADEPAEAAAPD